MRNLLVLLFSLFTLTSFAQSSKIEVFTSDTLLVVLRSPEKGFYHDYILFIPKETPVNKKIICKIKQQPENQR